MVTEVVWFDLLNGAVCVCVAIRIRISKQLWFCAHCSHTLDFLLICY